MKITITGAKGIIGTILSKSLLEHELTLLDLPFDITNLKELEEKVEGQDAIIHLAWDSKSENYLSQGINTDNILMAYNVYTAAFRKGAKRVIMASTVHADNFYKETKGLISIDRIPVPDSPYGASKVFIESLGRYFAEKGLGVICVRLGGVNREDEKPEDPYEAKVWLKHKDCVDLLRKCISAEKIKNNYEILYAVSENEGKRHDTSNNLGWSPKKGLIK